MTTLYFLFLLPCINAYSDETKVLVTQWAPRVWLHNEEVFNPSSVDFHLSNVEVRDKSESVQAPAPLSPGSIPRGESTLDWHLNTREDIECVNCFQDFFYGQSLDQVPSYAFVTEHQDRCNTVDVTYTFFYPFNYGKDVCVGLDTAGVCLGEWATFGNHLGDWEHVSLRLQNGKPKEMYLDVHSFGAWYSWKEASGTFDFHHGKPLSRKTRTREGKLLNLSLDIDYPAQVFLEDGHPVVYSANGSHGVWAQEGKHTYLHILSLHLDDFCNRGQSWDTWNYLDIQDTGPLDSFPKENSWVDFRGNWGNIAKMGCELEPIVSECGLVEGPRGPYNYFNHDMDQPPVCN